MSLYIRAVIVIIPSFSSCFREPGVGRAPLRAQDFMANNLEHLELLKRMGVTLIHLKDGRVQLVQHAAQVHRPICYFLSGRGVEGNPGTLKHHHTE